MIKFISCKDIENDKLSRVYLDPYFASNGEEIKCLCIACILLIRPCNFAISMLLNVGILFALMHA